MTNSGLLYSFADRSGCGFTVVHLRFFGPAAGFPKT